MGDGLIVDYMKDFNENDLINFSDQIKSVTYNINDNYTSFVFLEKISGLDIEWKFKGDLTNTYTSGDMLNLKFSVLAVAEHNNIIFESLNFFEDAYRLREIGEYPELSNYQI